MAATATRHFLLGIGGALGAAFFVGAVNVVSKAALDAGAKPVPLNAAAYLLAALVLLPWLPRFRLQRRSDLVRVAGITLFGGIIAPVTLFFGIERVGAVTASLLVNLEILGTTVLAAIFLHERFTLREGGTLLLIALGGVIVGVGPDLAQGRVPAGSTLVGVALLAAAFLSFSVDSTISTPLSRRYEMLPLLAVKTAVGALVLALVAQVTTGHVIPGRFAWPAIAFNGVLGIIGTIVGFYTALRIVGATRTVVVFSTSALWGALGGWLVLDEALAWPHVLGGTLMIAGVIALAVVAPRAAEGVRVPPAP